MRTRPHKIGIALGSGAARGWAHIGVIRALEAAGIVPEIVCGSSVGAIVGAAYASGRLDAFEGWVRGLERGSVLSNLDLSFRGGLLKGTQFFDFMSPELPDAEIESLPRVFGAVAADLETGQEVWMREGSLHDALRASVALPGLITPAERGGRWLVDGGLVNPVPISLCRAMGADYVVAVDLNSTLLQRQFTPQVSASEASEAIEPSPRDEPAPLTADPENDGEAEESRLMASLGDWARELRNRIGGADNTSAQGPPSIYEVMANSINIMQVRITRSRMAGDPADLLVTPRLADFALLDLDRGAEAIEEGARATERSLAMSARRGGETGELSG